MIKTRVVNNLMNDHDLSIEDLKFALHYLLRWGYLPSTPATKKEVKDAATEFQFAAKIVPDGVIGPQTHHAMNLPRCGCRDDASQLAVRWNKPVLKWCVLKYLEDVPGLSRLDQDDIQIESLKDYERATGIPWMRTNKKNEANLLVSTGSSRMEGFDGAGRVLAWCELPQDNANQILMKFDAAEAWVKAADGGQRSILYKNVDAHEKGHGHGMLHITTPGVVALLNPIYNPAVDKLLAADKQALWELGYAKDVGSTPVTPTKPTGGSKMTREELKGWLLAWAKTFDSAAPWLNFGPLAWLAKGLTAASTLFKALAGMDFVLDILVGMVNRGQLTLDDEPEQLNRENLTSLATVREHLEAS